MMKAQFLVLATVFAATPSFAEEAVSVPQAPQSTSIWERFFPQYEDHRTEHEHVFTPEEEAEYRTHIERDFSASATQDGFKFKQTDWAECSHNPSGNFETYKCARARQISQILLDYLSNHIYTCVDAGLKAQGGGTAADIHIVHDGILADRRHSPRSLHAEARAIDVKSFEVRLTSGATRKIVFEGTANRAFYKGFRSCWGKVVHDYNGCPYYQGKQDSTATIGWENADHQHHMHTSVPYCVNGKYGDYYYQK